MSGSTYNAYRNQITYKGYCALGGASNPNLWTIVRHGRTIYFLEGY